VVKLGSIFWDLVKMDLRWLARLVLMFLASSSSFLAVDVVRGNLVFPVHHKFKGRERSLTALKAHDVRRHRRILFDVDLELGGNGRPSDAGSVSCFLALSFAFKFWVPLFSCWLSLCHSVSLC
jgi:hypothetical protein